MIKGSPLPLFIASLTPQSYQIMNLLLNKIKLIENMKLKKKRYQIARPGVFTYICHTLEMAVIVSYFLIC